MIKRFESHKGDSIKHLVDISKIDFDYHEKYNLSIHSHYKEGADIEYYLNKFDSILNHFFIEGGQITLYRALMLNSSSDLKKPYGIFWAYNEKNAQVIDDEGYEGKRGDREFILKGTFDIRQIDWTSTFDLFLMNSFMEGEIRTFEDSEPLEIDIYHSNS
jgi:hypothetical protein